MDEFLQTVHEFRKLPGIFIEKPPKSSFGQVIFEGAQGIMLDQDLGFFPHVTRSNTTTENAHVLAEEMNLEKYSDVFYVTRSYQTRHGIGPMSNEHRPITLINNEGETNVSANWQGTFRTGMLDVDLLKYAIQMDRHMYPMGMPNLVVTCVDQTGDIFPVTYEGKEQVMNVGTLASLLDVDFDRVYVAKGPNFTKISYL
jgi:adenylosuccinate synthase